MTTFVYVTVTKDGPAGVWAEDIHTMTPQAAAAANRKLRKEGSAVRWARKSYWKDGKRIPPQLWEEVK